MIPTVQRTWLTLLLALACFGASVAAPAPGVAADASAAPPPDAKTEFSSTYATYQKLVADKKFADALPYAERAYQLGMQLYGPKHKNTAALALNLGDTQLKAGQAAEAVATLDTALGLYEQVYGKDALELVDPLMARGDAVGAVDPTQQLSAYKRGLEIAHAHLAPDNLILARLNVEAGAHLLQDGNGAVALPYLQAGYDQYKAQRPANDAVFASAAFWLGKYYVLSGDAATSKPYLEQAVLGLEGQGASPNQLAIAAHGLLVTVYVKLNEPAKATEQCLAVGRLQTFDEASAVPLYRADPDYPADQKVEASSVQIEFTIDAAGAVRDPKVLKKEGSDAYADSALKAIAQWRFAPRFVDGNPVDTSGVQLDLKYGPEH